MAQDNYLNPSAQQADYFDDFMQMFKQLETAKSHGGDRLYNPTYGGWGASEMKWNSMQNLAQNWMNYNIMRETNEANKELAEQQNQWNIDQWNREINYNDPSAQVDRLRKAGLSAAAAAQSVSNIPASSLQSADLANQQIGNPMQAAPYGNPMSGLMQAMDFAGSMLNFGRGMAALRKENVEANVAEHTEASSIDSILTQNDAQHVALNMQIEELRHQIASNPYHERSIRYKAEADSYSPEISRLTMNDWKLKVKTAEEYYGWVPKYHDKQIEEIQSVIDKNIQEKKESESRVEVNKSTVGVNNATISNLNADTDNKRETKKLITQEWVGKVVENVLQRFGAPQDPTLRFGALVASGVLKASEVGEFLKASKSYVESSGRVFNTSTPALRDIFLYSLNPGAGAGANTPVWSHGTVTKPLDWLKGTIGRYTPFEQKSY